MLQLAESIVLDILRNRMDVADDRSWIRDQNRKIPADTGLYLVVGMVDEQVIGVSNYNEEVAIPDTDPVEYALKDIGQVVSREVIQIDILSRDNTAIKRRWEILTALRSTYAQQKQEANYFKIFRIPSLVTNSSVAEGGSNINRFSIQVVCHVWYRKENTLPTGDYYDDFKTRVDDAKTISTDEGIIEFRIKDNAIIPYSD